MKPHINFVCHLDRSGYGIAAQRYAFALSGKGYGISITPLLGSAKNAIKDEYFSRLMMKHAEGDPIYFFACIPPHQKIITRPKRSIGMAVFENENPPKEWIDILNKNDVVVCPSKFCERVFREAGVKRPIFVLPHVINHGHYYPSPDNPSPDNSSPVKPRRKIFKFLYVGTFTARKGVCDLMEAYIQAFKKEDGVSLTLLVNDKEIKKYMMMNHFKRFSYSRYLFERVDLVRKKCPPIRIINKHIPCVQMPYLYKNHDCLVLPTMGEGFCLPALEAIACGVPVIISDVEGIRDYAHDDNCFLLKDFLPLPFGINNPLDNVPQYDGCSWNRPSTESIISAMTYVYSHYDEAIKKALIGSKFVRKEFNYDKATGIIDFIIGKMGWGTLAGTS